jgi:hypothetical protein
MNSLPSFPWLMPLIHALQLVPGALLILIAFLGIHKSGLEGWLSRSSPSFLSAASEIAVCPSLGSVVVGDVSGKGLKAAMTVSAIVGGLRQITPREPAKLLASLNRQLIDELAGGFVTCCAALISPEGGFTIANAGHLSPYRNGKELTVEGGFPLGIDPEGSYEQTEREFAPGDRLIFISAGVIEARNVKGELYGFERTESSARRPRQRSPRLSAGSDRRTTSPSFRLPEPSHRSAPSPPVRSHLPQYQADKKQRVQRRTASRKQTMDVARIATRPR